MFLVLLRLARWPLLVGGALFFALGAALASYQGYLLHWETYVVGHLFITALQVMGAWLEAYWETPVSRATDLPVLPRETLLAAALVALAVGASTALWLIVQAQVGPLAWVGMGLFLLLMLFHTTPPLALAYTGYGEVFQAVGLAGLIPVLSYAMQTPAPLGWLLLLATAPGVVWGYALWLVLGLARAEQDEAAGRKTLVVRLGQSRAVTLYHFVNGGALALTGVVVGLGLPARVALGLVLVAPLIWLQFIQFRRWQQGAAVPWQRLQLVAYLTLYLAAYLLAFGFWVAGH